VKPNYFAVIFTSTLVDQNDPVYHKFSTQMQGEIQITPVFLGMETYREATGKGVTISYWESKKEIQQWKENAKYLLAQQYFKSHAYSRFELKTCRVERAYEFKATDKN
jgi:heme-degrading monooxygenase HmoA